MQMAQNIKEIGLTINSKEKENKYGKMVQFILDNIKMVKNMVKENILGKMDRHFKEIGF